MEAIGASVSYDAGLRTVTASKNGITVKIPIGENTITVNDSNVIMDTKAVIKDGRTYIPLRAVFSAFGYDVNWHDNSKTVYLNQTPNNINGGTTAFSQGNSFHLPDLTGYRRM